MHEYQNANRERQQIHADLERLGLPVFPGCRSDLVATVIEEYGIPIAEILGKLDDDPIIRAVHCSLGLYGLLDDDEDDGEDDEDDGEDDGNGVVDSDA